MKRERADSLQLRFVPERIFGASRVNTKRLFIIKCKTAPVLRMHPAIDDEYNSKNTPHQHIYPPRGFEYICIFARWWRIHQNAARKTNEKNPFDSIVGLISCSKMNQSVLQARRIHAHLNHILYTYKCRRTSTRLCNRCIAPRRINRTLMVTCNNSHLIHWIELGLKFSEWCLPLTLLILPLFLS